MILSHRHKFIFIKGIKVAGTSAEIAISQACGPDDIITPITPADERYRLGTAGEPRNYAARYFPQPLRSMLERRYVRQCSSASAERLQSTRPPRARFHNHMPLTRVLELAPEGDSYEVLSVERSPYAKVLSLANWSRHARDYNRGGRLETSLGAAAAAVDRIIDKGIIGKALNIDRYRDRLGIVRTVPWKAQTLAEDVERFFTSRGLLPVALVHAKRGFDSDKVDPVSVLRPDQIRLINELFAEEFTAFGWPMMAP